MPYPIFDSHHGSKIRLLLHIALFPVIFYWKWVDSNVMAAKWHICKWLCYMPHNVPACCSHPVHACTITRLHLSGFHISAEVLKISAVGNECAEVPLLCSPNDISPFLS